MPYNFPSTSVQKYSFGPAVVLMGIAGVTPATDLGSLKTDDAVTLEITSEKREITQGNPKMTEYTFVQAAGAMLKFTGIEWQITSSFYRALGSGTTGTTAGTDRVLWGGDPLVTQTAIWVRHQMPISAHTLNIYAWKCVPDTPPKIAFTHDEHSFELSYKLQRAAADWNGTSLVATGQLFMITEQTT